MAWITKMATAHNLKIKDCYRNFYYGLTVFRSHASCQRGTVTITLFMYESNYFIPENAELK